MADSFFAPPQAYTRDVLVKAYEWLKTQPAIVQERANSADALVSLFLHHRRVSIPKSRIDAEVTSASEESFQSDLRAVAEGLRQFEEPRAQPQPVQRPPSPPPSAPTYNSGSSSPHSDVRESVRAPMARAPELTLDSRSLEVARDTMKRLNLSSEAEAVRMLLQIGHERLLAFLTGRG